MNIAELYQSALGHPPYDYQQRLAEASALADLLTVPTGAGKTAAVVLGWLWRRRFAPAGLRLGTPRRLVYCLPTRALVSQTTAACASWIEAVGLQDEIPVCALMGGEVDRHWDERPDIDQILVGTQDMLLSRALNRGYAMSAFRWPVQFGWLNNDALWVFDETQLMGVGLSTAAQLQGLRSALGTAAETRSLFMSATNDPGRLRTIDFRATALDALGLSPDDEASPQLAVRLTAPKPLAPLECAPDDTDAIASFAAERHTTGTLTLVVVNRVARAQAIFRALHKIGHSTPVRLLHSRLRGGDRAAAEDALQPGFSGIVVSTQVVEAGLDLSARLLVTDLAPWASLVQRFGRCNRTGAFGPDEAEVVWVDLPSDGKASVPYSDHELDVARARLAGLADVGIPSLQSIPDETERPALPVIRRRDLLELFDTEPDLAGHHIDVSRFVRSSEDRDVHVAWRNFPADKAPPEGLDGRPTADELARVPVGALRKLLKKGGKAWRWDRLRGDWQQERQPAPGHTVLLSTAAGGYADGVGWTGSAKDRPTAVPAPMLAPPDADGDDPWSQTGTFVDLQTHLDDTVAEVEALAERLPDIDAPWTDLGEAARWHDAGKAHPAFQDMLTGGRPEGAPPVPSGGPWAKSDRRGRARCSRPHFRHELVSSLAWLAHGGDDLTAYLIAAHHGKVRLHLRARPTERLQDNGAPVALGVHDGEMFPGAALGGEVLVPETSMDLRISALGGGEHGTSWHHRMTALVRAHGPFRLAMWEALLRVADWRASRLRAAPDLTEGSND